MSQSLRSDAPHRSALYSLRGPVVTVSGREGEQGESEGRRVVRYPDAQQLFVGNVPHDVDKTELKEFFERKSLTTTNNPPPLNYLIN